MIVSAHQPAYLPWLGYFHKMALCDVFVFFEHVSHSKKDFTTRNKIKTSQGPMWLTVPVCRGTDAKISDLVINEKLNWQRQHLKSLFSCYQRAEYFSKYIGTLEEFYLKEHSHFSDMVFDLTKILMKILGLNTELVRSKDLNIQGSKNEGIVEMLDQLGAKKVVFGAHGTDYVDPEYYHSRGIRFYYQNYQHPTYPQLHGPFLEYMCVLDLIFNCGPNSLPTLMSGNILKSEITF